MMMNHNEMLQMYLEEYNVASKSGNEAAVAEVEELIKGCLYEQSEKYIALEELQS